MPEPERTVPPMSLRLNVVLGCGVFTLSSPSSQNTNSRAEAHQNQDCEGQGCAFAGSWLLPLITFSQHDYRAFHRCSTVRQIAKPEFRTWQINKNSYRLIIFLSRMADLLNAPRMPGMIAMRCIYASNIHTAIDQALDNARCICGRPQGAHYLGPIPASHRATSLDLRS